MGKLCVNNALVLDLHCLNMGKAGSELCLKDKWTNEQFYFLYVESDFYVWLVSLLQFCIQ